MEHARGDKLKERNQHLGIDRRITLKWMLKERMGKNGLVSFGSE
jgi:hypothetical protein